MLSKPSCGINLVMRTGDSCGMSGRVRQSSSGQSALVIEPPGARSASTPQPAAIGSIRAGGEEDPAARAAFWRLEDARADLLRFSAGERRRALRDAIPNPRARAPQVRQAAVTCVPIALGGDVADPVGSAEPGQGLLESGISGRPLPKIGCASSGGLRNRCSRDPGGAV